MIREFAKTAIRVPNCPPVPAYETTCSKCGATEKISAKNWSGAISPERLNSMFRNKGWIIGKKPSGDVCPKCQVKKGDNVVPIKQEAAQIAAVEPPREMNKEDRRLIFSKIDEVYLDNAYSKGWTDKKVAMDLGVPLAWVKSIREENFGPEGLSEESVAIMNEARAVIKSLQVEVGIIEGHVKEGQKVREDLFKKADAIIAKLAAIEAKLQ